MTKKHNKTKVKKQNKKTNHSHKEKGFLDSIPGLIKDVASIGSLVGSFMGTPFGAQTGSGKLSNTPASRLTTAPATVGLVSRTPNWDFKRAPDVGYGPGIRVSGRVILGEIAKGNTYNGSTTLVPYFGLAASGGILTSGTPQLSNNPLSFVVLSPVSGFTGTDTSGEPERGAFGNSDNIFQKMATCFQRYKIVDASIVYAPNVGTSDEHTVVMSWIPDPGLVLNYGSSTSISLDGVPALEDVNFAMSIPDSVTTPSWAPTTLVLPLDKSPKRELLYINDVNLSLIGPNDADGVVDSLEARQLFEGGFIFSGFGVESAAQLEADSYILGTVFCDMTIDLYQMAINAAPPLFSGNTDLPPVPRGLSSRSSDYSEQKKNTSLTMTTPLPFVPFPTQRRAIPPRNAHSWYKQSRYGRRVAEKPNEDAKSIDGEMVGYSARATSTLLKPKPKA